MREAAEQHERFVAKLREAGVEVVLLEAHDPEAPDACFPNNWFTTHPESEVGGTQRTDRGTGIAVPLL